MSINLDSVVGEGSMPDKVFYQAKEYLSGVLNNRVPQGMMTKSSEVAESMIDLFLFLHRADEALKGLLLEWLVDHFYAQTDHYNKSMHRYVSGIALRQRAGIEPKAVTEEGQESESSFQAACAAIAEPLAALLDHPDLPSEVKPHWHDAISVLNDRFDSEFDLEEKPGAFVRRVFGGIAKAEPRRSSWDATLEDFGKAMQWLFKDDRTPKVFSDAFSDALVALSNEAGSGISQDEINNRTPELLKRIVRDVKE